MNNEEKLKEAKRLYKTATPDQKYVLESLFPELKESEDEKIRKYLLKLADRCPEDSIDFMRGVKKGDIIAWLEKQGEKKPVWSEKDDGYKLVALSAFLNYYDEENPLRKCLINWLKSLKQRMGG